MFAPANPREQLRESKFKREKEEKQMTKGSRLTLVAAIFAAAILLGPSCFAQTVPFLGAGSSAAFNAFALAGTSGTTPLCTNAPNNANLSLATNVWNWTQKNNGVGEGVDSRGAIDPTKGSIWVEWATGTANASDPPTAVCAYLNIDSIAGNRLFFGTASTGLPSGSFSFPGGCAALTTTAGLNQVPILPPDQTGLPTAVCSAINGVAFNAAPSDIRAEDAKFGVQRALTAWAATATGLGYGPGPIGLEIESGITGSANQVQAVDFNIAGDDPVNTSTPIAHSAAGVDKKAYVSLNVGGQVVLVLVNTADTTSNGLGVSTFHNINSSTLARVFTGRSDRTRDLILTPGLAAKPLTVLQREPLSGTMNTFEFQIPRTLREQTNSQEEVSIGTTTQAINPTGALPTGWTGTLDPLDLKNTKSGALKIRVIGTGQMVSTLATGTTDVGGNTLSNQIGYAFFSFGNVKSGIGFAKYLTVDGADPLYPGINDNPNGPGGLPACTAPCPASTTAPFTSPTFTNVANGGYPIWNVLRVITTGTLGANTNGICSAGATVCQLAQAAQTQIAQIPDFVAYSSLTVFRSHQTLTLNGVPFPAHNGNKARTTEEGGDVNGKPYLTQEDLDSIADTGLELISLKL
jgi:hypothetical protein